MMTPEREIALQAKLIRCERFAHSCNLMPRNAAIGNKLMTLTDIDILARQNDCLRDRCGGLRYFTASNNWLANLNR